MIYIFLTVATLMAFWQVSRCDFINYDDHAYITENNHIRTGLSMDGIRWAFTTDYAANWHPLTWISHMLDVQLFGLNPQGHHLTNLFFHIANTLLLFVVLRRMSNALWQSAFVAALFALHPLHVESVAWVAERKDVLSAFFWMATMGAYCLYVERPGTGRYLIVLLLFVLGLMAKPMLVTLPFVLLLLDFWPLQRYQQWNSDQEITIKPLSPGKRKGKSRKKKAVTITEEAKAENSTDFKFPLALVRQLFWEKIPLFTIAALSSIVTYIVQQKSGAVQSIAAYPLNVRLENAFVSYVAYIGKMLWPDKLAVIYPHPGLWQRWQVAGAVLILVSITLLVIRAAKRYKYLTVGWFWYVGTLVPVIGIIQVGAQARADRYTYIPLIGLFIMTAWLVPDLLNKWRYREKALMASATIVLSCFSIVTCSQVSYWQDSLKLSDHALSVTDNNFIAYYTRGSAYASLSNKKQALEDYDKAIAINPIYADAYFGRGAAHAALGDQKQAIEAYDKAIELNPKNAEFYANRGTAYATLGDYNQALEDYDKAIKINPERAEYYANRGATYVALGNNKQSFEDYDRAIKINPEFAESYSNRGATYAALGNYKQAIEDYDRAIDASPKYAEAYNNRGAAYAALGNYKQAIEDYDRAIEINPRYALAYHNRAASYEKLGNHKQAYEELKAAAVFGDQDVQNFFKRQGKTW